MHVILVPPDRLDALKEALEERGAHHLETKGEHEAFRVEMGRWPVVAYASGKLTFQEPRLVEVLEDALAEALAPADRTVVGSDETGKGEWLGPLVVAACAVAPDQRAALVARGVMDSKELSGQAIDRVARAIEERAIGQSVVVVISPTRFNELWPQFKAEGKSLNDLVAWAHAKAIGQLLEELDAGTPEQGEAREPPRILVDEFDRVATQARTARAFDVDRYEVEQRVRAEDEVAVAAASVLAKAARERWIDAFEAREEVPVRSLTREQAKAHEQADAFAKTGYL